MTSPRRALVVGGGIAGPTVALFLHRAGIEPIVFEAYPRTEDVGGALQIAPNGVRVFAELGLADALLDAGHRCCDMAFRNHGGRLIGIARTARAGCGVNVARPAVHRIVRDEAERRGIDLRYRKRLTGIAEAGREVVASFDDGTTEVGDFLVGADGVHSRVRACILPEHAAPRDTEMVAIGGLCAEGVTLPVDPDDANRLTFVVGPRYQLGYGQFRGGRWGWWCHARAAADARAALMGMPGEALRDCLLERYRGWSAPVTELIGATETWFRNAIHDVPQLPAWHRGRVLLLGDAAHAMSPAAGQGASLALEDAMAFGRLAADAMTPIEATMARFEARRRRRAEKMVAQGYANDRRSEKAHGAIGMWLRDRVMMPIFASVIEKALCDVYSAPAA